MKEEAMREQLTLVIGASGKTGRRVASKLEAMGRNVRRGSRSGTPAFDWADRDGWTDALEGVTSVYITYTPDISVPQAADDIQSFCEVAKQSGVEQVVLLSGRVGSEARDCEVAVGNSGLRWTVIRASWFAQNFDEGEFLGMVLGGAIALPMGVTKEPIIDIDDISDIAVAALTDDRHDGETYEVTGPDLLSMEEVAREIADASGRELRYVPLTSDEFAEGMRQHGMDADMIDLLLYLFRETESGTNAYVTDGVERALGRPARSFRDYARRAAATGIWAQDGGE